MNAKAEEGVDVEAHIQRIRMLKLRVEEQGEQVTDTVYNTVLLSSVSNLEDYKNAVASLESTSQLTPETVIDRILEEYRKLRNGNGRNEKTALFSKSKTQSKSISKGGNTREKLKCNGCGKEGRLEKNCWKKYPELKPKWMGKSKKKAAGEKRFVMSAVVNSQSSMEGKSNDNWYLDSCATKHLTPNRNAFITLEHLKKPWNIITAEGREVQRLQLELFFCMLLQITIFMN